MASDTGPRRVPHSTHQRWSTASRTPQLLQLPITGANDRSRSCSSCENLDAPLCQSQVLHKWPQIQMNTPVAAMDSTSTLEAPTTELTAPLATTSTDRCANCGAQLAPDQRYCIQCGERRSGGGLRDALPRTAVAAPAAPAPRQRAWMTPNNSLIAGIATLLLAMGVGVLIGRSGDHGAGSRAAATPQVVTVSAGTGGTAAASGAAAGAAAGTAAANKTAAAKKKASKTASKSKVSGASSVDETAKKNGVKLPPKVVKVGQKCEKGAKGCQGGKFTGNFFGGG
jgi:hypothetical protein